VESQAQSSTVKPDRSAWGFLGGWLGATALGAIMLVPCFCGLFFVVGTIADTVSGRNNNIIGIAILASVMLSCAACGAIAGLAQGEVVAATRPTWQGTGFAAAWCRATGVGIGLGCVAFGTVLFLNTRLHGVVSLASDLVANAALVAGLVMLGLAQWWVLRRRVRWAALWIPLTIGAWECAIQGSKLLSDWAFITFSIPPAGGDIPIPSDAELLLDGTILLGTPLVASLITGLGMVWLSRRRIQPASAPSLPAAPILPSWSVPSEDQPDD
jgi:hypothetical protein